MVIMEFWHAYTSALSNPEFGSSRSLIAAMERNTASLHAVSQRSIKLALNSSVKSTFDPLGKRYVIADNITFDILVSIYDVNSTKTLAFRISNSSIEKPLKIEIKNFSESIKRPNFELRCIGLQNGNTGSANIVNELYKAVKGSLTEVDIFGNETRHICIDMKTGLTYDLLLENRRYRAAELVNKMTKAEFDLKTDNLLPNATTTTQATKVAP